MGYLTVYHWLRSWGLMIQFISPLSKSQEEETVKSSEVTLTTRRQRLGKAWGLHGISLLCWFLCAFGLNHSTLLASISCLWDMGNSTVLLGLKKVQDFTYTLYLEQTLFLPTTYLHFYDSYYDYYIVPKCHIWNLLDKYQCAVSIYFFSCCLSISRTFLVKIFRHCLKK